MGVIHRFQGGDGEWDWEGVPRTDLQPGITAQRFISRRDGSDNLELRYFEIEPGARSNHERHNYEHAVLILRGRGTILLGEEIVPVRFGDAVFVESDEVHQFRAAEDEPLGFLCTVLDKELRVRVHGEQRLTIFDGGAGQLSQD